MVLFGPTRDKASHDFRLKERPAVDQQPCTALRKLSSQLLCCSFRLGGVLCNGGSSRHPGVMSPTTAINGLVIVSPFAEQTQKFDSTLADPISDANLS